MNNKGVDQTARIQRLFCAFLFTNKYVRFSHISDLILKSMLGIEEFPDDVI